MTGWDKCWMSIDGVWALWKNNSVQFACCTKSFHLLFSAHPNSCWCCCSYRIIGLCIYPPRRSEESVLLTSKRFSGLVLDETDWTPAYIARWEMATKAMYEFNSAAAILASFFSVSCNQCWKRKLKQGKYFTGSELQLIHALRLFCIQADRQTDNPIRAF